MSGRDGMGERGVVVVLGGCLRVTPYCGIACLLANLAVFGH